MSGTDSLTTAAPPSSAQWLRYSTGGLLVLMTTASLILAVYLGVGRSIGMSNADITNMGLFRLIYLIPMLAVWTFGLSLTLARKRCEAKRPAWAVTIYLIFIATAIGVDLMHMTIIFALQEGIVIAPGVFGLVTVISVVVNVIWWMLILVVILREGSAYLNSLAVERDFAEDLPEDRSLA